MARTNISVALGVVAAVMACEQRPPLETFPSASDKTVSQPAPSPVHSELWRSTLERDRDGIRIDVASTPHGELPIQTSIARFCPITIRIYTAKAGEKPRLAWDGLEEICPGYMEPAMIIPGDTLRFTRSWNFDALRDSLPSGLYLIEVLLRKSRGGEIVGTHELALPGPAQM
jgi:hypothetical protein